MGFYLRKSFSMGPIRLNLSKSGLGLSAGVKGARLGVNSKGRSYVHAGRGGLYFRKYQHGPSSGRQVTASGRSSRQPVVLYEDTDVTFPAKRAPHTPSFLRKQLVRRERAIANYLLMPLAGFIILAIARSRAEGVGAVLAAVLGTTLVVLWPIPMWRAWRMNRAGTQLGKLLSATFAARRPVAEHQLRAITETLQSTSISAADGDYECRRAYLELVLDIVEDRKVTPDELAVLAQAERVLTLSKDFVVEARADAFRHAYVVAIADDALTEDEERILEHVRSALGIPKAAIQAEVAVIGRLAELRRLRQRQLPEVPPSVSLQKSEVCHYEAPVRVLKERNLRSFQSNGQKYKVRGLSIDKEGRLLVTNKRALVVHERTMSIPYKKLVDLEVDDDRNLLLITKDGAKSPAILSTPDAMKAGAILAAAAGL